MDSLNKAHININGLNDRLGSFRSKISICSLNIRSLSNVDHIIALHDMAESHKFDCFAISETFLSAKTSPGELMSILPSGYEMLLLIAIVNLLGLEVEVLLSFLGSLLHYLAVILINLLHLKQFQPQ